LLNFEHQIKIKEYSKLRNDGFDILSEGLSKKLY